MVEGSHCMTPKYLAAMLEMSRRNLGLDTIDIYYVHNPETQLAVVDRKEFLARIGKAFEFLERAVTENKIAYYGVATWNGLRAQQTERMWLSLDELLRVAREVGGDDHHFRAIQLPYNLAMPEAVTLANQGPPNEKTTAVALAKTFGAAVCASASLLRAVWRKDFRKSSRRHSRGSATMRNARCSPCARRRASMWRWSE